MILALFSPKLSTMFVVKLSKINLTPYPHAIAVRDIKSINQKNFPHGANYLLIIYLMNHLIVNVHVVILLDLYVGNMIYMNKIPIYIDY